MPRPSSLPRLVRRLPSGRVPRAAIRRYVDQIVEKFRPQRVILFGSHAYGKPDADSDVDLLVVMPAKNELSMMGRIGRAIDAPFPLDLLVRTPEILAQRLGCNDWFLREIVEKGIVLYGTDNAAVGLRGGANHKADTAGSPRLTRLGREWVRLAEASRRTVVQLYSFRPTIPSAICFWCQQVAEKYLKALIQERGLVVPRTNDCQALVRLLIPTDPTLEPFLRAAFGLSGFAVGPRYPHPRIKTDASRARSAWNAAERIRAEVRRRLGLRPRR
jgi:uncharacterized protein